MEFSTWLRQWLERHALKEPQAVDRTQYTVEVMERVRALSPQSGDRPAADGARRWLVWPGWLLALAAVTAAIVFVIGVQHRGDERAALTADNPMVVQMQSGYDRQEKLQEPAANVLVVAQSQPVDNEHEWLKQTVEVLVQFDEPVPVSVSGEQADDGLLDELEWLDDSEFNSTS